VNRGCRYKKKRPEVKISKHECTEDADMKRKDAGSKDYIVSRK
jgi:hypothetical protein